MVSINNVFDDLNGYAWSAAGGTLGSDGSFGNSSFGVGSTGSINADSNAIALGGANTGGGAADGSATFLNNTVAFIAATSDTSRPIVFGNDGTITAKFLTITSANSNTLLLQGVGPAGMNLQSLGDDNLEMQFSGTSGLLWIFGNNIAEGGTGQSFEVWNGIAETTALRIDASNNVYMNENGGAFTCGDATAISYALSPNGGSGSISADDDKGINITDGWGVTLNWNSDGGGLSTGGQSITLSGASIFQLGAAFDSSYALSIDNANRSFYASDGTTVQVNFSTAANGVVFPGNASITSFGGVSPAQIATTSLPDPTTNEAVTVFDDTANLLSFSDGVNWKQVLVAGGSGASLTNLPRQVYSGSFSGTGTATTSFVVTIGTTQAGTSYEVNVTPTSALSAAVFYISAKTTTTFTVTYLAGLTGTVTFDWSVFP